MVNFDHSPGIVIMSFDIFAFLLSVIDDNSFIAFSDSHSHIREEDDIAAISLWEA